MKVEEFDKHDVCKKLSWIMRHKDISLVMMAARIGITVKTLQYAMDANDPARPFSKTREYIGAYIRQHYKEGL